MTKVALLALILALVLVGAWLGGAFSSGKDRKSSESDSESKK